jgi:phosphopantothenoylcysteine decarboxylase/phosphopantothenate--cysteine ligase
MAAAVADFRPVQQSPVKIKRGSTNTLALELVPNPDLLAGLVANRVPGQFLVGFAAETGDAEASPLEHAAAKARRKGTDLTVANVVAGGAVFGAEHNRVVLLDATGETIGQVEGSKDQVADAILEAAAKSLGWSKCAHLSYLPPNRLPEDTRTNYVTKSLTRFWMDWSCKTPPHGWRSKR